MSDPSFWFSPSQALLQLVRAGLIAGAAHHEGATRAAAESTADGPPLEDPADALWARAVAEDEVALRAFVIEAVQGLMGTLLARSRYRNRASTLIGEAGTPAPAMLSDVSQYLPHPPGRVAELGAILLADLNQSVAMSGPVAMDGGELKREDQTLIIKVATFPRPLAPRQQKITTRIITEFRNG